LRMEGHDNTVEQLHLDNSEQADNESNIHSPMKGNQKNKPEEKSLSEFETE